MDYVWLERIEGWAFWELEVLLELLPARVGVLLAYIGFEDLVDLLDLRGALKFRPLIEAFLVFGIQSLEDGLISLVYLEQDSGEILVEPLERDLLHHRQVAEELLLVGLGEFIAVLTLVLVGEDLDGMREDGLEDDLVDVGVEFHDDLPGDRVATKVLELALYVDLVEESTQLQPDILVKGGDYSIDQVVGGEYVQGYGGEVRVLAFLDNCSTSAIVEKLKGPGA